MINSCSLSGIINLQSDSFDVIFPARKERRYWDGEKTVFVVLLGSSVVLPCVNRRPLWREGLQEDQQQVAHWDFQPPGVRPDRANRLVDLYASGERRDYGPLFALSKMKVEEDAFTLGDFSLSISDLKPVDKGLYSCHLHHHYCGLHERRIFRLTVGPPLPPAPTTETKISKIDLPEPSRSLRNKKQHLTNTTFTLFFHMVVLVNVFHHVAELSTVRHHSSWVFLAVFIGIVGQLNQLLLLPILSSDLCFFV